jgi:hypothetical protein
MATKLLSLLLVIGLTICAARVESQLLTGTPVESRSPPKHPAHKKTEPTSPAENATPPLAAESPAASPTPRSIRKKTTAEMSPSPTPTPVASPTPRKIRFPRLFKPKRSPSPTPAGVKPAPVSGTANQENGTLYARADWPVDASPERLCSSDGSKAANPC